MIEKTKETLLAQFVVKGLIFLIFLIGIFVATPSLVIYFLMISIIANLVLGFINDKKSISMNITLFFALNASVGFLN